MIGSKLAYFSSARRLLDIVPSAYFALSTRRLRSAYSGNCKLIRRSSDNATQNIGFNKDLFDAATASSFVASNSAFVNTWYDQSGNNINFTQSTLGSQPRIYNSGTIDTMNSKAAPFGSGGQNLQANITPLTTNFTIIGVGRQTATVEFGYFLFCESRIFFGNQNNFSFCVYGDGSNVANFASDTPNTNTLNVSRVQVSVKNGSTSQPYFNGTALNAKTGELSSSSANLASLFSHYGVPTQTFNGNIAELIVYNRTLTTLELNLVTANIKSFYNIT